MKTRLSILTVACCLSTSVMGQMKIGNFDGKILVGNYNEATLIIKNTGKAILSGGLVEGGGTLRIEAGEEIEIQPGFEAKAGANVEFK